MKFEDLKKRSAEDLKKELDATLLEMMRYTASTGSKDTSKIRELKRKIARIKTLQNAK